MHIEAIDALRCRVPHEESWLVGRFDRMQERHVIEGALGCPVCRADYPIREGTVYFDPLPERRAEAPVLPDDVPPGGAEDAILLAAMLGLAEPGGVAVLAGRWAAVARALDELVSVRILLLNPPGGLTRPTDSAIVCRDRIPLAPGSLRAVALDALNAVPAILASTTVVLRRGGRLVLSASGSATLPSGLVEVARDAHHVVAEAQSGDRVIPLRRG